MEKLYSIIFLFLLYQLSIAGVIRDEIAIESCSDIVEAINNDTTFYCFDSTYLEVEALQSGNTGIWRVVKGEGVTFSDSTNEQTHVYFSKSDTIVISWSEFNSNACIQRQEIFPFIVRLTPDASAGRYETNCIKDEFKLNAQQVDTVFSAYWEHIAGPTPEFDPNNANTPVSFPQGGFYSFVWTVEQGSSCPVSRDTSSFWVSDLPVGYIPQDTLVHCIEDKVEIKAIQELGVGYWEVVNGNSSINDPNKPQLDVNVHGGLSTLLWRVSNGACPDAIDTLVLITLTRPRAFAGESIAICRGDTVTAEGNAPAGLNMEFGFWQTSGDGKFLDSSSHKTLYIPGSGDLFLKDVELHWHLVVDYNCIENHDIDIMTVELKDDEDCVTSTNDLNIELPESTYPNPANGAFTVTNKIGYNYQIFDLIGNVADEGFFISNEQKLDLQKLTPGIYMLEITKGEERVLEKIIVEDY